LKDIRITEPMVLVISLINLWFSWKKLVKNWWFPDQLFDFFKVLRTVIIYQNQVFEFFSEETWLWILRNRTDNHRGSVPVSNNCPPTLVILWQDTCFNFCWVFVESLCFKIRRDICSLIKLQKIQVTWYLLWLLNLTLYPTLNMDSVTRHWKLSTKGEVCSFWDPDLGHTHFENPTKTRLV